MAAKNRHEALDAAAAVPAAPGFRRMVGEKELLGMLPFSRATLLRKEKAGTFPKSFHVSENRRVWFLDTIIDWQRTIAEHDPHFNPTRGRGKGRRRVSGGPT